MSRELNRGLRLMAVLKGYHPDFPPNGLAIFMAISLDDGLSGAELTTILDIPKATVSRNLRMLGCRASAGKEGLKLLELRHDEEDYRIRRAYLTPYGKQLLKEIIEALK